MTKNKILLIAIGVSITDIRIAMALQKLNEEDYDIINDEQMLERERGFKIDMDARFELNSIELPKCNPFILNDRQEEVKHKPYKNKLNIRTRDITNFRLHPQMVRRG